jgi:hypothetical protein
MMGEVQQHANDNHEEMESSSKAADALSTSIDSRQGTAAGTWQSPLTQREILNLTLALVVGLHHLQRHFKYVP